MGKERRKENKFLKIILSVLAFVVLVISITAIIWEGNMLLSSPQFGTHLVAEYQLYFLIYFIFLILSAYYLLYKAGWIPYADHLYQEGEYELAAKHYSLILFILPWSIRCLKMRGMCYLKLKEYDSAIQDFSRAIKYYPYNQALWDSLIEAFYKSGKIKMAVHTQKKKYKLRKKFKE